MGCIASCFAGLFLEIGKYDDLTVTGFLSSNSQLEILPGNKVYTSKEPTILKIKESFWNNAEDFAIEGLNGRHWLTISKEEVAKKEMRDVVGLEKKVYAWYKLDKTNNTGYIGRYVGKRAVVLATIRRSARFSRKPALDVFIHNPAMDLDKITEPDFRPQFYIRGDFPGKKYSFLIRDSLGYNMIAEVVREWEGDSESGYYYLNIGYRIDIAFMGITAILIDELFS